ncbi:MAG: YceH family protein [candidate division KSB1 bacterium]|nr:YceH family protein [candidate division KSB1 bacterium]MDZ7366053.1 YceH family protein [candidate division KSB1 bacterium]MDZ7404170.1 YceH family protein [candidate division KSB1 bacterium]
MLLSNEEARVFGCLIEKSQATPEYYPMTLNALVAACNQKTSRDPVVDYAPDEVEEALRSLKEKGLCAFISGGGRVTKYAHRGGENGLELSSQQLAVLSVLLLRGPQTVGEIKGRTERQFEFSSLEAVEQTLEGLMAGEKHFVEKAPRRAGQKEDRYRHLFFVYQDESEENQEASGVPSLRAEMEEMKKRVAALETEIAKIKKDLY